MLYVFFENNITRNWNLDKAFDLIFSQLSFRLHTFFIVSKQGRLQDSGFCLRWPQ
ncbi:unnamed protein product [Tenebrio molitor]|nr:unnamed protein product [Tenebrio molitor]